MTSAVFVTSAFISALLATAKDTVSKKVSKNVTPLLSSLVSFLFALPFYILLLLVLTPLGFEQISYTAIFFQYVFFRTVVDVVAETSKMKALQSGDLSSVSGIIALHPLIALFIAPMITGEPNSGRVWMGVLFAVLGNILIMGVPKGTSEKRTIFWALITAIFFAVNNSIDRLSVQVATPVYSGFMMTLAAGLVLLPTLKRYDSINTIKQSYKLFLLRGFFETFQMSLKLFALIALPVPVVAAIIRLSLLFSVISGGLLLGEKGTLRKIIGASISIAGIGWAII